MKRSKKYCDPKAILALEKHLCKYFPTAALFVGAGTKEKMGVLAIGVLSRGSSFLSYESINKAYKEGKISELADGIAFEWKLGV